MPDETNWLTPAAHKKLTDEFEELTTSGREEIEARIAEARSHGDIKENADYDAAKNEQGLMEARIRQIRHLLENSEVREALDTGRVEVGSIVTVSNADLTLEVLIAGSEHKVSGVQTATPDGPLGKALLGAAVGDKVKYQAPGGEFKYTIESIHPFED